MSFHNLQVFMSANSLANQQSAAFTHWLTSTLTNAQLTPHQCEQQLIHWQEAPSAHYCHPREEHLIPLHVCFGMVMEDFAPATIAYQDELMQKSIVSLLWQ